MATGRTLLRWTRCYLNGYDMSGYGRNIGPLVTEFGEGDLTAKMGDVVQGVLLDVPNITPTALNCVFDNTASTGVHAVLNAGDQAWNVMIPIGIRAAPAEGDPVFMSINQQLAYTLVEESGALTVNVPFGMYDVTAINEYNKPWGTLLHENSAETAVNDQTGVDDNGASTAFGGYMMYHVFAGNGTVTITTQHASTNLDGSFANLGGCTTGSIDASAAPLSGVAYTTALTTTVNRYLRWQISLGTATTVTFALGFVRRLWAY